MGDDVLFIEEDGDFLCDGCDGPAEGTTCDNCSDWEWIESEIELEEE